MTMHSAAPAHPKVTRLSGCIEPGLLFEGPYWSGSEQATFWVDILKQVVFCQRHGVASSDSYSLPEKVSSVVEVAGSDKLIVTGERHLWLLDRKSGQTCPLLELVDERRGNRCNDAKCDPAGNLWFGTMDDAEQENVGQLWCLSTRGELVSHFSGLGIVNTLAWDPMRARMYFGDSKIGTIFAADYKLTPSGPQIGRKEVFVGPDVAPGVPDGSAIDEDGMLWNARWDGGCVIGIDSDGRLARTFYVGAKRPTSCAFVGAALSTLAITTAAVGLEGSDVGDADGRVLGIDMQVAGQQVPSFGGTVPSMPDLIRTCMPGGGS